jgi:hypothetical protein
MHANNTKEGALQWNLNGIILNYLKQIIEEPEDTKASLKEVADGTSEV